MTFRSFFGSITALLLACVLVTSATAQGVALPAHGGSGGQPFRLECPQDHYLVGFEARHGAWLDRIAPLCARWSGASRRLEQARVGRAVGGMGGVEGSARCPAGTIVSRLNFLMTVDSSTRQPKHVDTMGGTCNPALSENAVLIEKRGPSDFLETGGHLDRPRGGGACAPGERAVGIHGRADLHIDALGLICGPAPGRTTPVRAVGPRPAPAQQPGTPVIRDAVEVPSVKVPGTSAPSAPAPQPAIERFSPPMTVGNNRLHACLELPNRMCGDPAAAAFCKGKGFATVLALDSEVGQLRSETWFGEICTGRCRVFTSIVCER